MMTDNKDKAVRTCGSSYAYCDGNCSSCSVNNTYATNSTSVTGYRPSEEEYNIAKELTHTMSDWISLSRRQQRLLLDELCAEREKEKGYDECYNKHRETIRRYEFYKEVEKRKNG